MDMRRFVVIGLALLLGCSDDDSGPAGSGGAGGSPGGAGGGGGSGGSGGGSGGSGGGGGSGGLGGAGGSGLDDPLFQTPTATVAEYITPDAYACETEQSACGLPCPADGLWVAINETDFRDSATCSACMEVVGPLGSVVVEVVENCAGACENGEIELSREAFDLIGDASEGHVDVTWRLVPCERTGPIAFAYEADSHEWWAGIQVRNPALPVSALEHRTC